MADFESYSPEAIIRANLYESASRHRMICEQELSHLHDLACEIANGEGLTAELFATLPEHRLLQAPKPERGLSQNEKPIAPHMRADLVWKNLCLCGEILKQACATPPDPEAFFPDSEELSESAADRILYRRSSYTDDAYLQFATRLSSPRASYADTFEAVCEGVYTKQFEYGILPLEDSEEGELSSFRRLIDRYDLKIAATCDVRTAAHGHITRFALLRLAPIALAPTSQKERFFECAVSNAVSVGELLYAAECCDLIPVRIHSGGHLPDQTAITRLVFRAETADLPTFLLYLCMAAPNYRFIGFYPHISRS